LTLWPAQETKKSQYVERYRFSCIIGMIRNISGTGITLARHRAKHIAYTNL
jgi:hypothetical protein